EVELLDLRKDDHVVALRVVDVDPGEREGIRQRQGERPDLEAAAGPARDRVLDPLGVAAGEAGQDQPGRAPQGRRDLVAHQYERGGGGRAVLHLDVDGERPTQGNGGVRQPA